MEASDVHSENTTIPPSGGVVMAGDLPVSETVIIPPPVDQPTSTLVPSVARSGIYDTPPRAQNNMAKDRWDQR